MSDSDAKLLAVDARLGDDHVAGLEHVRRARPMQRVCAPAGPPRGRVGMVVLRDRPTSPCGRSSSVQRTVCATRPGSLLLVVGAAASKPDHFVERALEERGAVLSPTKLRTPLEGRVAKDEIEPRTPELLDTAILKRLQTAQTVVVPIEGFEAEQRERYVRAASGERRPRHLILLEAPRDQVLDTERAELDESRRWMRASGRS